MTHTDELSEAQSLAEVWAILDELGEVSLRLSRAAEAAAEKMGAPIPTDELKEKPDGLPR